MNGIIVLSKSLEVRNMSEKSEKIQAKLEKLDEDEMLCNTSWIRQAHCKNIFLPFRVLLNVGIDPNFPQKGSLYSERNFASGKKK